LPFSLGEEFIELQINVSKKNIDFKIMNPIDKQVKEKLNDFLRQIAQKMKQPKILNTLKYMDNSLPQLCELALKKLSEESIKSTEETKDSNSVHSEEQVISHLKR